MEWSADRVAQSAARRRPPISKELAVRVFRRDRWLCRYCGAPVVFPPALRLMAAWLAARRPAGSSPPAYAHKNWRRDRAPLLDRLGAVIDHRFAHKHGGGIEEANLATACNKCNIRKGDVSEEEHSLRSPLRKVQAAHGEPTEWDGLSLMFLELAAEMPETLTSVERAWAAALVQR